MSPQLDAALVTLAWCVVLYFFLLLVESALRLFAAILVMFKRGEERRATEQYTKEYIDAINRLADSGKKEGE